MSETTTPLFPDEFERSEASSALLVEAIGESWGATTFARQSEGVDLFLWLETATPSWDFVAALTSFERLRLISERIGASEDLLSSLREAMDSLFLPTDEEEIWLDYRSLDSIARAQIPKQVSWGTEPGYTFSSLFDTPEKD